jgi:hypothetical protein
MLKKCFGVVVFQLFQLRDARRIRRGFLIDTVADRCVDERSPVTLYSTILIVNVPKEMKLGRTIPTRSNRAWSPMGMALHLRLSAIPGRDAIDESSRASE